MRKAFAALALCIAAQVAGAAAARAQQAGTNAPAPADNRGTPAPSDTAPPAQGNGPEVPAPGSGSETSAPANGSETPAPANGSEAQGPTPGPLPPLVAPAPTPAPNPAAQPTPPVTPPNEPLPQPATLGEATTTPAEHAAPSTGNAAPPPKGLALGIELNGGMTAGARFPASQALRSVEEAVDGTFGASVWLGGRGAIYGLSLERTGLGKDHYGTNANGETMEASYGVDTLSLLGRWYFSKERPAFYLGLSVGAALPDERSTGTRAPDGVFVTPGESYSCSASGRVGGAASATAGVEFEVANRLAILADARAAGFLMSKSADAFGGCSPGTGPAVIGALRIGASYRFGL
ncbi:MAG TPA: hypothetical protein VHC69_29205 [Polyangiaceae bacterium]|nr:hypothetical protein [Polyangiaceae bacterium]